MYLLFARDAMPLHTVEIYLTEWRSLGLVSELFHGSLCELRVVSAGEDSGDSGRSVPKWRRE